MRQCDEDVGADLRVCPDRDRNADQGAHIGAPLHIVLTCLFFFGLFLFPTIVLAQDRPAHATEFAQDISDRSYLEHVLALIRDARESIDVSMFVVSAKSKANHPAYQLLEALSQAASHGVKVRLFLNSHEEVSGGPSRFLDEEIFENLHKAGVHVFFVQPKRRLHDKLVVIDEKVVVEGSMNWTLEALRRNWESATVIYSSSLAREKRKRLENLPLLELAQREPLVLDKRSSVILPAELLDDPRYFARMLSRKEGDCIRFYLVLCLHQRENEKDGWVEDPLAFGKEVGVRRSDSDHELIRDTERAWARLAQDYGLIRYKTLTEKEAAVGLVDVDTGKTVWVPLKWWTAGFVKELTHAALFSYLLLLRQAKVASESPFELDPPAELAAQAHVPVSALQEGLWELRMRNLIEVHPRHRYSLNAIDSPDERRAQWLYLLTRYGKAKVDEAHALAALLDEPSDPVATQILLDLLRTYPSRRVARLVRRVSHLDRLSPYRSVEHVRDLLKKSGGTAPFGKAQGEHRAHPLQQGSRPAL